MSDPYRIVTFRLLGVRPNAVKAKAKNASTFVWIPRSLLHGSGDLQIDRYPIDEEVSVRLREWKAEELGLA